MVCGIVGGAGSVAIIAAVNANLLKGTDSPWSSSPAAVVLLVLLCLAGRLTSNLVLIRLAQNTVYEIRSRLGAQIGTVPLRKLEALGAHTVLSAVTEDVAVIAEVAIALPNVCINVAVVVTCTIYLWWLSQSIAYAYVFAAAVGIALYAISWRAAGDELGIARLCYDALAESFSAAVFGAKEAKLCALLQRWHLNEASKAAKGVCDHLIAGLTRFGIVSTGNDALAYALVLVVICGVLAKMGAPLRPGTMSAVVLVLLVLKAPLDGILGVIPNVRRARVSMARIQEIGLGLAESTAATELPCVFPPRTEVFLESLELIGVTYDYGNSNPDSGRIGPVDVCLRTPEIVFVVGRNGSGKSTIAKLLTGLYYPSNGYVRVNGMLIHPGEFEQLRSLWAAVFSDYHLCRKLPCNPDSEMDMIANEYLHLLDLGGTVSVRNGMLSTIEVSQGQRKRLALLGALLQHRSLYMFDEWASDQDLAFRGMFYRKILPGLRDQGKTAIVITHDEEYFDIANRILVVEKGRIQEECRNPSLKSSS